MINNIFVGINFLYSNASVTQEVGGETLFEDSTELLKPVRLDTGMLSD